MADTAPNNVTVTKSEDTQPFTVAQNERTIAGRILPWKEEGATSAGGLRFTPQAIRIPTDVSRVKLLRDHSPAGVPVGVMTAWETRLDGLYATFAIASTPDGDRALTEASEKIRDAFSVEVAQLSRRGPDVQDSLLRGVALVPFPAFASALVDSVQASAHDDESPDVPDAPDDEPDTTDTDPADDGEKEHPDMDTESRPAGTAVDTDADAPAAPREAVVPTGLHNVPAPAADTITASEAAEIILGIRNGVDVDEAHAALVDITNSGAIDAVAPGWLGRMWEGVTYQRRIVPLITQAPLKSWKAVGYKWKTKPTVAKYAGDKTDIPSTAAAMEAVEVTAQRWAGGNDIDRKFLDFNDAEFLAAYWAAMAESYAYETDKEVGNFLVTNATAIEATQPDIIRAVATAAIEIDQAVHTPATFALINPNDLTSILEMSQLDAPRWMDLTPVSDPSKWQTSEFVPAGTVVVGAKPAATFYELAGSPIRAQAEHIAKGGFDAALFGYTATLLNRPEALRKITFGTTGA